MCQSRAECYLVLLSLGCFLMSFLAAAPMFVLTHPGDECLLFVSVRGEALIYGNPAGCHFIAYGHCLVAAGVILLLLMLFCRKRKGFPKRPKPSARETASNRTLPGTLNTTADPSVPMYSYNPFTGGLGVVPSASMTTVARRRFARLYSAKVLLLCLLLTMLVWITAFIVVSGYVVSCGELQYETRRQLYGRTTLGVPIKALDIACWSVFRDVDFHSRFHFDHYEYSGQWHGQYRGYQHGRVHHYNTKHKHVIPVAAALEMSIAGSTVAAVLWTILLVMLTYLRIHQKKRQSQEVAESIEDARIYASSRDNMEMIGQKLPADQSSVASSHQSSSILSQKPDYLRNPNGTITPASYAHISSRPGTSLGSGPYAQVGGGSQISTNSVQYVQLSNGVIVPMSQQQQQPQRQMSQQSITYAQLQSMQNLAASAAAAQATANGRPTSTASSSSQQAIQQQQQILAQQQLQLQQIMLQQQQQAAMQQQQQAAMQQQQQAAMQQQQQVAMQQPQQQLGPQIQQQPVVQQVQQQLQQQHLQQQQHLSPQLSSNLSPIQNLSGAPSQASLPRTSSGVARSAATAATAATTSNDEQDGDTSNDRMAQRLQINASKDIGMKCSQI